MTRESGMFREKIAEISRSRWERFRPFRPSGRAPERSECKIALRRKGFSYLSDLSDLFASCVRARVREGRPAALVGSSGFLQLSKKVGKVGKV